MGRRKKKMETSIIEDVKKEAPKVETNLVTEFSKENKEETIPEPTNDIIVGDTVDTNVTEPIKEMLFEPSKYRTVIINRNINKKSESGKINHIKTNLKQRPMVSSYRGSRTKNNKTKGFALSFKLGDI